MKPGQRKWRSFRVIVSWDAWMFDDFDVRWSMNSSWVPHTTCIVLQSFRSWPRSWGNLWTSKAPDRPLWCRDYCRMSWSILHYYSGKNIHVILIGLHTWFSVHRTVHMCTIYIFFAHPLHFLRRELLLRVADHRKGCTRQSRNSNCAGSAWIALNSVAGILKTTGCSLQGTFVCSLLLIDVSN